MHANAPHANPPHASPPHPPAPHENAPHAQANAQANADPLHRPDLVVFDVDGTLHDVTLWWPDLLRDGLRRYEVATGIACAVPDDASACAVIGNRDAGVWGPFLPPAHRERWPDLRALVLPMEVAVLRAGADYLYPGAAAVLRALRRGGVRTALASNCRSLYMAAMVEGQGLGALTNWQFCLDSPGVADKTGMLRAAMAAAGTSRGVMVGDRESDQEAARGAGIPFVWRPSPFCDLRDVDARWHGDPRELLRLLGFEELC